MRTLLLLLTLFTMTDAHAQFARKRQVLLFGDPQSAAVKEQLALFQKEAAGITDRDITVTLAAGKRTLYKTYAVTTGDPFVLVLVGKDGGEKFRAQNPVPAKELFAIIDAMPMRQSEMRRRKGL